MFVYIHRCFVMGYTHKLIEVVIHDDHVQDVLHLMSVFSMQKDSFIDDVFHPYGLDTNVHNVAFTDYWAIKYFLDKLVKQNRVVTYAIL